MKEETKEKRKNLSVISNQLKENVKGTDLEGLRVNELLMLFVYNPDNNLEFNSFKSWIGKGFKVKKGEKAFLLWGEPIKNKKAEEKPQTDPNEDDNFSFFPLAYVFSNSQVEPINNI